MTLPMREVNRPSAFDTRCGSEQASDGCGGEGEVGRKSTAVVGSSGAGEADTGEGGGLSERGAYQRRTDHGSMRQCGHHPSYQHWRGTQQGMG